MIMKTSDNWESGGEKIAHRTGSAAAPTRTSDALASASASASASAQSPGISPNTRTSSAIRYCDIPYKKLPASVVDACDKRLRPANSEVAKMRRVLADFIVHQLKDTSKATVENIARQVVHEYPDSFEDRVGGVVSGSGCETMANRLYSAVLYEASKKKDPNAKKRKKNTIMNAEEIPANADDPVNDAEGGSDEKTELLDEYGCKEWHSKLPSTESAETQEYKKIWLCTHCYGCNNMPGQVSDWMDKTYPTQRSDIPRRKGNVEQVMLAWPYLKQPTYFFQHATRLVGHDLKLEFEKAMNELYKDLIKYLSILSSKSIKPSEKEQHRLTKIKELLGEAKQSAQHLKSEAPYILAVFPLLAAYFYESFEDFVVFEDVTITAIDIEEQVRFSHPYLVVAGRTLYGEAEVSVAMENKVVMTTSNILEGIQCVFLAYYVFGFMYPENCNATFEFFQRYLFGINPKDGNKRSKKKRTWNSLES